MAGLLDQVAPDPNAPDPWAGVAATLAGNIPPPPPPQADPMSSVAAALTAPTTMQTSDEQLRAYAKTHALATVLKILGGGLSDAAQGGGTAGVDSAVAGLRGQAAQPLQLQQARAQMAGLRQILSDPNVPTQMKNAIIANPAAGMAAYVKNQELQRLGVNDQLGSASGNVGQPVPSVTPFANEGGVILNKATGQGTGVSQQVSLAPGATPKTFTPSVGPPAANAATPSPGAAPQAASGLAPANSSMPPGVTPDIDALVRTAFVEGDPNPVGWKSVAGVIMNRVRQSGMSPGQVVAETSPKGTQQFTGYGNSRYTSLSPSDPRYMHILNAIAPVVQGQEPDPTGGADSYYAPKGMPGGQAPYWAKGQTGQKIGTQIFYKGLYHGGAQTADAQGSPQAAPIAAQAADQNPPGWSGPAAQPAVQVVHGNQLPGGDPNQDYKVTPTDISVLPKSFNMETVQANRKAYYGSKQYTDATDNIAPINGLFTTLNSLAPGGTMSIAALDTLQKSLNPTGIVRPTSVSLFLDHLGTPEELKSHILGVTGNGFLSPTILRQIAQVSWTYARSHVQSAQEQADKDTALAVSHGFKPDDVGETAPNMPSVPTIAQDKVPPPQLRTVGKVYWGPNGPGKWTGKGWEPQ